MNIHVPVCYISHEVLIPSSQQVRWNPASENDIIMYKFKLDNELNKITISHVHNTTLQQYYNKL